VVGESRLMRGDKRAKLTAKSFSRKPRRIVAAGAFRNAMVIRLEFAHAAMASGVCSENRTPVGVASSNPRIVSSAPPRPRAITGVPHACASSGAMPKSSSAANRNARAVASRSSRSASGKRPSSLTLGPATACTRARSGPSPITTSSRSGRRRNASTIRSIRLYGTKRETVTYVERAASCNVIEGAVTGG
jgi:hypothetical protein